jgi:hypothetical protein
MMAVVINTETKLTYDDYVLLPEDGKIHDQARYQALEGVIENLGRLR